MTIEPGGWSKKLTFAILMLVCATILAGIGIITAEQWVQLSKWLAVGYLGSQMLPDTAKALRKPKE